MAAIIIENELPIGPKPRKTWLEDRAIELSRSIDRYISMGYSGQYIIEWSKELLDIVTEINNGN
jgi:hypothetical protein